MKLFKLFFNVMAAVYFLTVFTTLGIRIVNELKEHNESLEKIAEKIESAPLRIESQLSWIGLELQGKNQLNEGSLMWNGNEIKIWEPGTWVSVDEIYDPEKYQEKSKNIKECLKNYTTEKEETK